MESTPAEAKPSPFSPTAKLRKLLSPSSSRHLRSPSSPSMERVAGTASRPGSPGGLERTSSIPRLNSSSKVHTLARKFELKIETNAAAAAAASSNQSSTKEAVVSSPVPATLDEPQTPTPVNPNEETIRALVRIRPSSPIRDEVDPSVVVPDKCIRRCLEPDPTLVNVVNFKQGADKRQFSVDGLLVDTATQEDVFKLVGMRVVDNAVDGYNGSIFAYGQTGSGKTHTMQGDMTEGSSERGVIPRIVDYMFERLTASQTSFDMTCSYLEIYNEKIYDLLDVISEEPKYIREDATLGLFVQDLVEMPVASPRAALQVLEDGGKHRTVGSTAMNRESSRSHSVFTIKLTQRLDEAGVEITRKSTLHLVDLAGSEKQSHTGAVGTRLKEATQINKSLSVLGNVITTLVDVSNGIKRHVPYRDSKLTFLLRDALGGNSKTTLIATVSGEDKFSNETLSTLQFMQRAKHIKTIANKNEDTRTVIKQLQVDLTVLRGELDTARSTISGEQAKRAVLLEQLERLHMEKEDNSTAKDVEMTTIKSKLAALEAHVAASEAARLQADTEKQTLRDEIQDQAEYLAHAHDELDECQKMLKQIRLEFERARQTHTSDACLVATLREEVVKRDNDQVAQQDAWNQKLSALQADLASATQRLDVERQEAAVLRDTVAQLKLQLESQSLAVATAPVAVPRQLTAPSSATTPCPISLQPPTNVLGTTPPISEDGQPLLSPRTSTTRRSGHRHSESDLSEEFRQAIGSFSIPVSIEEAHRDLQLQHDQLLHVMQKLDGLRNSKKFLQHALQTTLTDNADMVQSLKKLQVERNTAMEALQQTMADDKKAKKMQQMHMVHSSKHSLGEEPAPMSPLPSLKRAATTFSGFSTIQKEDELKQLAADKVTLTSRLKATQAKVASLEDEVKRLRLNQPVADLNAWAPEFGRVARALLAAAMEENLDGRYDTWRALLQEPVELSHTPFYEGLVESLLAKLKQLASTVDNQTLTIQILEKELHCYKLAKEIRTTS